MVTNYVATDNSECYHRAAVDLYEAMSGHTFLRITRRAAFCMGIESLKECNIHIISAEDSPEFPEVERLTSTLHCNGEPHYTHSVLEHPNLDNLVEHHKDKTIVVVPYVNSPDLEKITSEYGWTMCAPPADLVHEMEEKESALPFLESVCPEAVINAEIIPFGEIQWTEGCNGYAIQHLGKVYSGGKGTLLVRSEAELAALNVEPNEEVKVTPFIDGPSLNINACVLPDGVVLNDVSLQVIGPPECTENTAGYCGNCWEAAKDLPEPVHHEAHRLTKALGQALASRGYKGWFGVDFLVDESSNHVYVVEVNPRLQGSTSMMTIVQAQAGVTPMLELHLAAHLGIELPYSADGYTEQYLGSSYGSHLLIRAGEKEGQSFTTGSAAGQYALEGGNWKHVGDTLRLSQVSGEQAVIHGLPMSGLELDSHGRLATVQTPMRSLKGTDSTQLTPDISALVQHVRGIVTPI